MAKEALRNVLTGEIEDIDGGSAEYRAKRAETYDPGDGSIKPLYEITSAAHADRIDREGPTEHDMGYNNKPLKAAPALRAEDLVFGHSRKRLSPAEVKHGIESHEQKEQERAAMFGERTTATTTLELASADDREEAGRRQAGRTNTQRRSARQRGRAAKGEGDSGDSGSSGSGDGSEGQGGS